MCRSSGWPPLRCSSANQLSGLQVGVAENRRNEAAITLPYWPPWMSCFVTTYSGQNRMQWPIWSTRPAFFAAAVIRSHSARFRAIGFSQSTCTPASSDLDRGVGVQPGRQGDRQGIDRLRGQQLVQVGVDLDGAQVDVVGRPLDVPLGGLARRGQHLGVRLADRRDRRAGKRLPAAVMHPAHEPQPDDPDANHANLTLWRYPATHPGQGI